MKGLKGEIVEFMKMKGWKGGSKWKVQKRWNHRIYEDIKEKN